MTVYGMVTLVWFPALSVAVQVMCLTPIVPRCSAVHDEAATPDSASEAPGSTAGVGLPAANSVPGANDGDSVGAVAS